MSKSNYRGGGGSGSSKRYWDNDEYKKEYGDERKSRRSRSRSRSRSSRSYSSSSRSSRSSSRSPKRPTIKEDKYSPAKPPVAQPKYFESSSYNENSNWQSQQQQQQKQPPPQQLQLQQQQQQLRTIPTKEDFQAQLQQQMKLRFAQTLKDIDYKKQEPEPLKSKENFQQQQQVQQLQQQQQQQQIGFNYGATTLEQAMMPNTNDQSGGGGSKSDKKKEKKRKKKKHHRSSSSSSSSSSGNSSSGGGKRRSSKHSKKHRDSDSNTSSEDEEDKPSKAIETQKKSLKKQLKEYKNKLDLIDRELKKLEVKKEDLINSRADPKYIEENSKIQTELRMRKNTIVLVLQRLTEVFKTNFEKPAAVKPSSISAPAGIVLKGGDMSSAQGGKFEYFDNGQYWCRICNVFPSTTQEMLDHYHTTTHNTCVRQWDLDEKPWRLKHPLKEITSKPGAAKVPYRGLQFFSPVTGWYCRLCFAWMGDSESALNHLKSDEHNTSYTNFTQEHLEWEVNFARERDLARVKAGFKPYGKLAEREIKQGGHDDGKSYHIQMRKMEKDEKNSQIPFPMSTNTAGDRSVDEWMEGKSTKVKLDIDTQKFAAIVKQKQIETKGRDEAVNNNNSNSKPIAVPQGVGQVGQVASAFREDNKSDDNRDRDLIRQSKLPYDVNRRERMEMRYNNRDRDRNRYDGRGGRRRTRSRSRSRSKDRSYGGRRGRSRSRSRSRSRDRKFRERSRSRSRDRKEPRKPPKPMIGKMPIFKRSGRDKEKDGKTEDVKDAEPEKPPMDPAIEKKISQISHTVSGFNILNNTIDRMSTDPSMRAVAEYVGLTPILDNVLPKRAEPRHYPTPVPAPSAQPPASTGQGGGLSDDFQQALDIIYSAPPGHQQYGGNYGGNSYPGYYGNYGGGGGYPPGPAPGYNPYSMPPPSMAHPPSDAPVKITSMNSISVVEDKSEPLPAEEEAEPPAPGEDDDMMMNYVKEKPSNSVQAAEAKPVVDDDLDDLRMLGIDMDDSAAAALR